VRVTCIDSVFSKIVLMEFVMGKSIDEVEVFMALNFWRYDLLQAHFMDWS